MGVPAFFRWLSQRYPKTVIDATKSTLQRDLPPFDNLYLDMNGIIHPCCNPPEGPKPRTEREMFDRIFKYIDSLVSLIQPRRLLFLAIDGVAPRAKMNQQRSRRFFKVYEAKERAKREEPDSSEPPLFDSNVITPGTGFLARLAAELHLYIITRLSS